MSLPSRPTLTSQARRAFLGAAATLSTSVLTSTPATAQTATGRTRLVGVLEEDPTLMNSAISALPSAFALSAPVYSALTRKPKEGVLDPELAEKWEISPDGLTYTFHLRKGVLWHDGKPFTSADVKFSLENYTMKLHPRGKNAFKAVDRIETPDENTVVFQLKQPSASLIWATDIAVLVILPKHLWEGTDPIKNPLNQKPIGTGPYKFVDYVRGESVRYERNEKYFGERPDFDEVVFRIIPDAATRLAALERGDIDMLSWAVLPQAEAVRISKVPGIKVNQTTNGGAAYIGIINTRLPFLKDAAVRQAIFHAIDRKFLQANVNGGSTSSPMLGSLTPASPLYNTKLVDYEFSADKANALLDKAGAARGADGTRFSFNALWPAADLASAKIAEIMKSNLEPLGIKVGLMPLDRPAMNQRAYVNNDFGMTIEAVVLGPDPDIGTERFYNSKNIVNVPYNNNSGYANPVIDELFDKQRVQTNEAARKVVYDEIQEILWKDLPIIPFFAFTPNNAFRSDRASHLFEQVNGSYDNFANVKMVKAPVADTGSKGVLTQAWVAPVAGAVVVAGAAALWLKRRQRSEPI
ncbi:ABC transporter substrate-binding protein [soil metagenome]